MTCTKFGLNTIKHCGDTALRLFSQVLCKISLCVYPLMNQLQFLNFLLAVPEDDLVQFWRKLDKPSRTCSQKYGFWTIKNGEHIFMTENDVI